MAIALSAISDESDNTFFLIDVVNVMKGLDVNKGSDPDDIPLRVLMN